MATRDHFALPKAPVIPDAGDGGPGFDSIDVDTAPAVRTSTQIGAESAAGDVSHYKRARAFADGEKGHGGAGFGMLPGDDDGEDDARFDTGQDDGSGVPAPNYAAISDNSNEQAGGRTI